MVLMWWGFWLLASLAGVGLLFNYYYWSLRLPQERVLTTLQGDTIRVRIEGRAPMILKLTMLDDGSTRLYPIPNLVDDDRAHVERLPVKLAYLWPVQYALTENGSMVPARLEGRTEKLLKWTSLKDNATHWELVDNLSAVDKALVLSLPAWQGINYPIDMQLTDRSGRNFQASVTGRSESFVSYTSPNDGGGQTILLADLSPAAQDVVRSLPINLTDNYPLDRVLTDLAGNFIPATIEGRSDSLVKYTLTKDGTEQTRPLDELSKADQAFLGALPVNMSNNYPVDRRLTDQAGHAFQATIDGRSDALVQYTTPEDSAEQSMAIAELSNPDQAFVRTLPLNLTYNYPQEWTLTDQHGRPMRVSIEARTQDVVKITLLADQTTHLYPISTLSEKDQAFVQSLPASPFLEYPLKSTLTDQQGHSIAVTIAGRSDDEVKFTRDDDGKTYTYAITKLSDTDQAYVKLLPVNLDLTANTAVAPESPEVKNMRDRIKELRGQIADLNTQIAGVGASDTELTVLNNEIRDRQSEMDNLIIKILNSQPAPPGAVNNQDMSATVAQLQQQITDLESTLSRTAPKSRPSYAYQQTENQLRDAEAQLNKIYDQANASGQ
jgi:ribosome modulation factor